MLIFKYLFEIVPEAPPTPIATECQKREKSKGADKSKHRRCANRASEKYDHSLEKLLKTYTREQTFPENYTY